MVYNTSKTYLLISAVNHPTVSPNVHRDNHHTYTGFNAITSSELKIKSTDFLDLQKCIKRPITWKTMTPSE